MVCSNAEHVFKFLSKFGKHVYNKNRKAPGGNINKIRWPTNSRLLGDYFLFSILQFPKMVGLGLLKCFEI